MLLTLLAILAHLIYTLVMLLRGTSSPPSQQSQGRPHCRRTAGDQRPGFRRGLCRGPAAAGGGRLAGGHPLFLCRRHPLARPAGLDRLQAVEDQPRLYRRIGLPGPDPRLLPPTDGRFRADRLRRSPAHRVPRFTTSPPRSKVCSMSLPALARVDRILLSILLLGALLVAVLHWLLGGAGKDRRTSAAALDLLQCRHRRKGRLRRARSTELPRRPPPPPHFAPVARRRRRAVHPSARDGAGPRRGCRPGRLGPGGARPGRGARLEVGKPCRIPAKSRATTPFWTTGSSGKEAPVRGEEDRGLSTRRESGAPARRWNRATRSWRALPGSPCPTAGDSIPSRPAADRCKTPRPASSGRTSGERSDLQSSPATARSSPWPTTIRSRISASARATTGCCWPTWSGKCRPVIRARWPSTNSISALPSTMFRRWRSSSSCSPDPGVGRPSRRRSWECWPSLPGPCGSAVRKTWFASRAGSTASSSRPPAACSRRRGPPPLPPRPSTAIIASGSARSLLFDRHADDRQLQRGGRAPCRCGRGGRVAAGARGHARVPRRAEPAKPFSRQELLALSQKLHRVAEALDHGT